MTHQHPWSPPTTARVAVLDDDVSVLGAFARTLRRSGHEVVATSNPAELLALVEQDAVDVVLSDILMPGFDGLEVLQAVHERSNVVPVILVSGAPTLDAAMRAFGQKAFALLQKPCEPAQLRETVASATAEAYSKRELRDRRARSEARTQSDEIRRQRETASFEEALRKLYMVYQPIVRLSTRTTIGYEALVRSRHPDAANPAALFELAHTLERTNDLAVRIREIVTQPFADAPPELDLFLNVLAPDLDDETFLAPDSPLLPHARRIVLEVSEQARSNGYAERLRGCRERGMRVAIDDLGAGYASLNSVAELEPEVIKLDMVLVRDVHLHPVRQRLVRALVGAAEELNVAVVAEGVETREELACLVECGCDLFQGWLFARPTEGLNPPDFSKV
jgi:EAL domain-containing protein (putative c-di-GMP-specific phosphodiesterase class I)/CheY-like chemotaxis protein